LSPSQVGIFNLGLTISGIIGLVIIFGLDRAVVRQIAFYSGKGEKNLELGVISSSTVIVFILGFIFIPIFWLTIDQIALFLFRKPELAPVVKVLLLSVPFAMFTRLGMGILQAYKMMKSMVFFEQVLIPFFRIVGTILVISLFAKTLTWISISYTLMISLGSILALIYVGYTYQQRKRDHYPKRSYTELLQFAWPFFGASILNRTNTYTETLLLGGLSTSQQVGLFSVSFKLAVTLTIIFQAINTVAAPFIAEMFARSDHQKMEYQYKAITRWGFTLALPLGLIMCLNSYEIIMVLNPEYLAGVPVLQILSLSQLMYVLVGPVALILTMTNYVRLNLVDLFLTLILSIILDLLLIPRYGAIGAAYAGMISIVFINIIRLFQVYRLFRIHPYHKSYLKPIIASVISGAGFFLSKEIFANSSDLVRLITTSLVFLVVYSFVILLLRQEDTDREVFRLVFRDVISKRIG
jgi:O-antigen/teichoic acid export membrane protein